MKCNSDFLSIPPYISTSWNKVESLQMSGNQLMLIMNGGTQVFVPDLDLEDLEQIFESHQAYLEKMSSKTLSEKKQIKEGLSKSSDLLSNRMDAPFKMNLGALDSLGVAMQHNPSQANAPNLPQEILSKIGSIAKIIAPEESMEVPQPEPHCNCPHCQIARAINEGLGKTVRPYAGGEDVKVQPELVDEEVTEEDLKFQQWSIQQTGDKLFTVSNKLDDDEKYNVFLGSPVGCTCGRGGKEGCEHILAVLNS